MRGCIGRFRKVEPEDAGVMMRGQGCPLRISATFVRRSSRFAMGFGFTLRGDSVKFL